MSNIYLIAINLCILFTDEDAIHQTEIKNSVSQTTETG